MDIIPVAYSDIFVDEKVALKVVVVFSERIQKCFGNLSTAELKLVEAMQLIGMRNSLSSIQRKM